MWLNWDANELKWSSGWWNKDKMLERNKGGAILHEKIETERSPEAGSGGQVCLQNHIM